MRSRPLGKEDFRTFGLWRNEAFLGRVLSGVSDASMPRVSGVNDERDALPVTSAEWTRRLGEAVAFETVGEAHFSLWKTTEPLAAAPPRFSKSFLIGLPLGCLALLLAGRWAADRIREGNSLPAQILGVALMVAAYGVPMVIAIVRRRRLRGRSVEEGSCETPPEGIPVQAVPMLATLYRRGGSAGWLWFEGDVMRFQGYGFDFRLRREDFTTKPSLYNAFKSSNGGLLRLPKGIATLERLWLRPGNLTDQGFVPDTTRWTALEEAFQAWESGTFTDKPSLFPPVRPVPIARLRLGWASMLGPSLFMAALLGTAALILPEGPKGPPNPWGMALAGGAFGLMWPYILSSSAHTVASVDREVDRAIEKDRAPQPAPKPGSRLRNSRRERRAR